MNRSPLEGRLGLRTSMLMAAEVGELARRNGLLGCVFISFTVDRVGVNSSGEGEFAQHMERLGDQLLAAIDDGQFDPKEIRKNPRAAQIECVAQRLYDLRDACSASRDQQWAILDRCATALSELAGQLDGPAKKGGKK